METTIGVRDEKRKGRSGEEEEGQGLGFGFGFGSGSAALSTPPQKLIRTDAFPSRYSNSVHLPHPSSSSGPTLFYDCNSGASDAARALHPFPSPLRSTAAGAMTTDFGGVGGAAALRLCCPFTSAQWQELHRQALIYKHLMSSVPVPPDLLLPPDLLGHGGGGLCNMRFTNSIDPEPGRCRRTDGKKWRCSRDVAPDQKYCERHMHRGRPRSRKPVELTKNKANRISTTPTTKLATKASITSSAIPLPKGFAAQTSGFPSNADLKLPYQSMELSKEPRYMGWMKEDTGEMGSSHQWELVNSSLDMMRSNRAPILQHYQNQLNLNYTDLNDQCYTFLNPDLSSMDEESIADQREPPRSFIDAWSTETPTATDTTNSEDKLCSVSHSGKLPLSTLSLSMNSGIEEGTDQIEMGLGLSDSMGRSQPLSWMATVSPLGGPLAEVLQSTTSPSPYNGHCCSGSGFVNLMSKSLCGSQEVSPQESPTRLASSPSGVLQKALVSLSDSSSSSSPTFASRSEIALQWLNQSK